MKFYWIKTHYLVKKLLYRFTWDLPTNDRTVYLTFDDGPTPEVTQWVLDQLQLFDAKATFFCIGENIQKHAEIFKTIINSGHTIGNHTFNHLNGWQTQTAIYLDNVARCNREISVLHRESGQARLFRPPYGKLNIAQSRKLRQSGYRIIMWDVLSADFDVTITPEKCTENVIQNIRPGSIVIFHDSEKAFENLKHALPRTLEFLKQKGYRAAAIRLAPEPDL